MITIPEIVKPEFADFFDNTYTDNMYSFGDFDTALEWFYSLPYDFQSGVYKAYLRSVGININVNRRVYVVSIFQYAVYLYSNSELEWKEIFVEYNTAEQAAINEAFKIRQQQLQATNP